MTRGRLRASCAALMVVGGVLGAPSASARQGIPLTHRLSPRPSQGHAAQGEDSPVVYQIGGDRSRPVTRQELLRLQRELRAEVVVGARATAVIAGGTRQKYGLFTTGQKHACAPPESYAPGMVHTHPRLAAPSRTDLGSLLYARSQRQKAGIEAGASEPRATGLAQALVDPRGVTVYTTRSLVFAARRDRQGKLLQGTTDAYRLKPLDYRFSIDPQTRGVVIDPPPGTPQVIEFQRGPVVSRTVMPPRRPSR